MSLTNDLTNLANIASVVTSGVTSNGTVITKISVGNTTVNTSINVTTISTGNATVNSSINATSLTVGSNVATFGNAVYIVANGNIGMGTSSPNSIFRLHLQNDGAAILSENIGLGTYMLDLKGGGSTYNVRLGNSTDNFLINVNNAERMRIAANGNVGIANTTPSNTLSVTGTASISGALTTGSNVATFGTAVYHVANGDVGIGTSSPTAKLTSVVNFGNGESVNFNSVPLATAQGQLSGYSFRSTFVNTGDNGARRSADIYSGYSTGAWGTEYLAFGVGIGGQNDAAAITTERMRIDGAGNVGISNTAPGSKFVVSSGISSFEAMIEKATVSATAATGNVHLDVLTQSVLYYTSNATANCTVNIRANSTVTANSILVNGQSLTVAFLNTTGATAYYPNVFSVDSTTVTPKWSGGTAPTGGNANSVDVYTYTIIKTANSTYTVLANQTQYK